MIAALALRLHLHPDEVRTIAVADVRALVELLR